jgi:hypothetical protein
VIQQRHGPRQVVVEEADDVVDEQVEPVAGPLLPQLQKDHRLLELVEDMPQV